MEPLCAKFNRYFELITVKCSVKDRYRIYTNVSMRMNQMKFLAHQIHEFRKYIDTSVYCVGKTLRMVNSKKYNKDLNSIENRTYHVE